MTSAALCLGDRIVYWDSILIALAALVCLLMLYAAYASNGRHPAVLLLYAPLALALGFALSRLMYWYCHQEQFSGLVSAFAMPSTGGYCLAGIVIGFALAALLLGLIRLEDGGVLLDASAPALALGLAVLRLSSLFNNSCRGKALITEARFQHLPFAYPSVTAAGTTEYRFAAFFAEALAFLLAFLLLLWLHGRFYPKRQRRRSRSLMPVAPGDLFLFFLLFFGAAELVVDSTRNDASFFHFNAFVSVAQMLGAVAILIVMLVLCVRSVRRSGWRVWHALCWLLWLVGLGGVGACEYLVQRHGDWQLKCYGAMSLACLVMVAAASMLRRRLSRRREAKD